MELFKPKENLLDKIGSEIYITYTVFIEPGDPLKGETLLCSLTSGFAREIEDFYRKKIDKDKMPHLRPIYTFLEATKNARDHGNKWRRDSVVTIGKFFGEEGLIIGVRDEGDFFTKEENVSRIINRRSVEQTAFPDGSFSCYAGLRDIIYEHADELDVDQLLNVLYIVHFLKNITF